MSPAPLISTSIATSASGIIGCNGLVHAEAHILPTQHLRELTDFMLQLVMSRDHHRC